MDYKQRIGMGGNGMAAGITPAQPSVGAQFNTNFGVGGSATGPALVLIGLLAFLVIDYVWTKGQQGGR